MTADRVKNADGLLGKVLRTWVPESGADFQHATKALAAANVRVRELEGRNWRVTEPRCYGMDEDDCRDMADTSHLHACIADIEARLAAAMPLAGQLIEIACDCADIDQLQNMLVKHGLIERVPATPEDCAQESAQEYGIEPGDTIYKPTAGGKLALDAWEEPLADATKGEEA
jgi:hypothetical protein